MKTIMEEFEEIEKMTNELEKEINRESLTEEEEESVCEFCGGTGIEITDEDDGEGHIMRGVGERKCICQIHEEEYNDQDK
jgi:transcription elongation GreA/GreB family factor